MILQHRVNTVEELRTVNPRFGVEIDIRHDNRTDGLYLNHDSGVGDDFEDYLKVLAEQKNAFVIFNTKEIGLETRIIALAHKYGIENYFFLDVEFPFIYRAAFGEGVDGLYGRIAVRYSEAEPIEQALHLAGKCNWVWVDVNTSLPLSREICATLREAGYKLALVSPDRWGRPDDVINYIDKMKAEGITVEMVMAAKKFLSTWEESGIIIDNI